MSDNITVKSGFVIRVEFTSNGKTATNWLESRGGLWNNWTSDVLKAHVSDTRALAKRLAKKLGRKTTIEAIRIEARHG